MQQLFKILTVTQLVIVVNIHSVEIEYRALVKIATVFCEMRFSKFTTLTWYLSLVFHHVSLWEGKPLHTIVGSISDSMRLVLTRQNTLTHGRKKYTCPQNQRIRKLQKEKKWGKQEKQGNQGKLRKKRRGTRGSCRHKCIKQRQRNSCAESFQITSPSPPLPQRFRPFCPVR